MIDELQFSFWEWMASYYMCTYGEVMNAALPSALKLASESRIVKHPDFMGDYSGLNEREQLIAEAVEIQKVITLTDAARIIDQVKVIPLIKTLIDKKVVLLEEELEERYRPKIETIVELGPDYQNEANLHALFELLEKKAPRQSDVLMAYLSLLGRKKLITKTLLLKEAKAASAVLDAMIKKAYFLASEKVVSRFGELDDVPMPEITLSDEQDLALSSIRQQFLLKQVILLHGVTSSGKTEVYIRLIQEVVARGGQVLYLLPEIALTTQIVSRLRKYFGNACAVFHSKFNEQERTEIWKRVALSSSDELSGFNLVLGARSSVFLPFTNLQLIIVDEEHDASFKQYDPAPRYNARDSAVYLAHLCNAKVLLGSATPSVESMYNARAGKYGLAHLKIRHGGMLMPRIVVADVREEQRNRTMKSHFTSVLFQHIQTALANREQVILFQNRRGYAPRLECSKCNWIPECKNCDVTLVYHKNINQLKCHYCGYGMPIPHQCPVCANPLLEMKGFGTEKVEDELAVLFPDAAIARMDLDSTRSKTGHQQLITDFEEQKTQILVGTQMVTKGLDFDNVSVVGILNADNMISFPDFRAFERSYQMMAQVSGRAGRKNKQGIVIVQTSRIDHPVIRYVVYNDYDAMFTDQLNERNNYRYPPFVRLTLFNVKHRDYQLTNQAADTLANELKILFPKGVLGPEFPLVSRIKGLFIKQVVLKLERAYNLPQAKEQIKQVIQAIHKTEIFKQVRIVVDVDPS
jgi:primosomal protein N' (replication factor Y)